MIPKITGMLIVLALSFPFQVQAGDLYDVTFYRKVRAFTAAVDTTLVTQKGKRVRVKKGTVIHVAGFTQTEVFVVSRLDKPNGFIKKTDVKPVK